MGCLTLADGGTAYSVPMSLGYDGNSTFYFQVQTDDDSDKMASLDATTTATFLVPEVRPPDWTSVVVRGAIEKVPDDETDEAYAAFAEMRGSRRARGRPTKTLPKSRSTNSKPTN